MSAVLKSSKIRNIVRILQMLRQWRRKSAEASRLSRALGGRVPADVPKGHLAVYVGSSRRRFVVRASYLNYPAFRWLLSQAEEVYGFDHPGPIAIPCDEFLFEEIIRLIGRDDGSSSAVPKPRGSFIRPPAFSAAVDEQQWRCSGARFQPESTPLLAATCVPSQL